MNSIRAYISETHEQQKQSTVQQLLPMDACHAGFPRYPNRQHISVGKIHSQFETPQRSAVYPTGTDTLDTVDKAAILVSANIASLR